MGKRILIAAPANCKEEVFKEYLNSLNHLIIPEDCIIDKFFVLNKNSVLKKFLKKEEYIEIENNKIILEKEKNQQKQWKMENYYFIAFLRNCILKKAREENYDYIFSIDSDVLVHPYTLIHLMNCKKDIISTSVWTKLQNNILSLNCGYHEQWGEYENKEPFKQKGIYKVGWVCIAVLISSKIFMNSNINYTQILGVDNTGSEDYAFFLKCYCNIPNLEVYISTIYPARHLYHEKDYERWKYEKNFNYSSSTSI